MSCNALWSRTQTLSAFRHRQGAGGQRARGLLNGAMQSRWCSELQSVQDGECTPGQARAGTVRRHGDPAFWGRGESCLVGLRMLEELVSTLCVHTLELQKPRQNFLDFPWVTTRTSKA